MKYFKYITLNKEILIFFANLHPEVKNFLNVKKQFIVRIMPKLYPCLIHCIISQDYSNNQVIKATTNLSNLVKNKIKVNKIIYLKKELLTKALMSKEKASLILTISKDIKIKKIRLKKFLKLDENEIINLLKKYKTLKINTIKLFCIFGCFKKNILCSEDPSFIEGLKIFLKTKKTIDKTILNEINLKYSPYNTIFSLLMWKIYNDSKSTNDRNTNW